MKKILALAFLLGLTAGAAAQTFPLNNIPVGKGPGKQGWTALAPGAENACLMIIAGVPTFSACPGAGTGGTVTSVAAGDGLTATPGPITTSGTIRVTAGAANTGKGSLNGTTTVDLALPSCSASTSALRWTTSTGYSCGTVGDVTGSGTTNTGDLASYTSTTGKVIAGTGYNAKQVPGLIPTTSTVTITNGANAIVTWTSHALSLGDTIFFCNSGGALNTGLTACVPATACTPCSANQYNSNPTLYYVAPINANTFNVATSLANARAGTFVTTSSAGSGTQTAFANAMACAGCVGELIYKAVDIANGVAFTTNTATTWNSFSLTAGIWKIWGNIGVTTASGNPTFDNWHATIGYGTGSGTITSPYGGIDAAHLTTNAITSNGGIVLPFTPQTLFLTSTQTINANASAGITGGTGVLYGIVYAERTK